MSFSEKLKTKVRERANFQCCRCQEIGVEIHHIVPKSKGGLDTEENAAPLCPNCHSKYGNNPDKRKEIREMRDSWYAKCASQNEGHDQKAADRHTGDNNVINFTGGVNRGIIANRAEIKTERKRVQILPPSGSIASSLSHRNYVKHLIDRYHEFKKSDVGKENMNYAIFYGAIKKEFGAKWDMVPLERFDEISSYIQHRIGNTILGKNMRKKGKKIYSTFEEYIEKYSKTKPPSDDA